MKFLLFLSKYGNPENVDDYNKKMVATVDKM
jgi:hypothetical protein